MVEISHEEIYTLYWKRNLTVNEIAKKYSVHPSFITRRMIKYGIKRRTISESKIGKLVWPDGRIFSKKHKKNISETRKKLFKEGKLKPKIKFKLTKEELHDLYWNKKLDVSKISKKLGLGKTTIGRWLKRYDIKRRTISEVKLGEKYKPTKQELYNLYWKKGFSTVKIGEKYEVSNVSVLRWLKEYKIEIRKRGLRNSGLRLLNKEKLHGLYIKEKLSCGKIGKIYGVDDECVRRLLIYFNVKRRDNSGENNPFWQGGISFEPYSPKFNKKLKKQIKIRDNYTCQECEKQGKNVHHIDYNKKNSKSENLITLCKSCHTKTNFKRKDWAKHFKDKMKEKIEIQKPIITKGLSLKEISNIMASDPIMIEDMKEIGRVLKTPEERKQLKV